MTEENEKQELAYCPNCNGAAMRKGKVIVCQVCNASFRYTAEGPKVAELGPFDELQGRVSRLEGLLGNLREERPHGQEEDLESDEEQLEVEEEEDL